MEALLFTAVAIGLYVICDRAVLLVEARLGRRLEHRTLLFFAMLMGSAPITAFIDVPSVLVVIGGAVAAGMMAFPLKSFLAAGEGAEAPDLEPLSVFIPTPKVRLASG